MRVEHVKGDCIRLRELQRLVEHARDETIEVALGRERSAQFEKAPDRRLPFVERAVELIDFAYTRARGRCGGKVEFPHPSRDSR